jgi:hydrogenase nickel incorporation protein HypB
MFRTADAVLLNKVDLLPYVDFDVDAFGAFLGRVNRQARPIRLSATRGDGTPDWYGWLRERIGDTRPGYGA